MLYFSRKVNFMKTTLLFTMIIALSFFSCDKMARNLKEMANPETTQAPTPKKKDGMEKKYYPDGSLRAEIRYVDGKKHGIAKEYYRNGNLKLVVNYEKGIKEGASSFYYENGKLYRETPYRKGKIEGTRKIYSNGKLIAEVPYKNGKPGAGLKEFFISGKPKTDHPKLVVSARDNRLQNNMYVLEVSFSNTNPKDEFYVGELLEGKFLHNKLEAVPTEKGKGKIALEVPPGAFLMEKINFVGVHYTRTGNPFITTTKYNLVIE